MSGHYHVSAKTGSRGGGQSAVAAAAYRAAETLHSEHDGQTRDYARKEGVEETAILTPVHAPEWTHDRETLWNRVEAAERRKDARLYREFEVSLPRELPQSERMAVVQDWARQNFIARGMVTDIAIHDVPASDGGRNIHAHVLLTDRPLDAETTTGFAARKDRSWNGVDLVEQARESWATHANHALARADRNIYLDHRSLVVQQADAQARMQAAQDDDALVQAEHDYLATAHEPEPKVGATATALEQRGQETERGELRRRTQELRRMIGEELRQIRDQIRAIVPPWVQRAAKQAPERRERAQQAIQRQAAQTTAQHRERATQARQAAQATAQRQAAEQRQAEQQRQAAQAAEQRQAAEKIHPVVLERQVNAWKKDGTQIDNNYSLHHIDKNKDTIKNNDGVALLNIEHDETGQTLIVWAEDSEEVSCEYESVEANKQLQRLNIDRTELDAAQVTHDAMKEQKQIVSARQEKDRQEKAQANKHDQEEEYGQEMGM